MKKGRIHLKVRVSDVLFENGMLALSGIHICSWTEENIHHWGDTATIWQVKDWTHVLDFDLREVKRGQLISAQHDSYIHVLEHNSHTSSLEHGQHIAYASKKLVNRP